MSESPQSSPHRSFDVAQKQVCGSVHTWFADTSIDGWNKDLTSTLMVKYRLHMAISKITVTGAPQEVIGSNDQMHV